jgi:hypothetical protein
MRYFLFIVIGAAVGAAVGVLADLYLAGRHTGYIPQTSAGSVAFYVGLCTPWAFIGAVEPSL